jgi:hypothetical protein
MVLRATRGCHWIATFTPCSRRTQQRIEATEPRGILIVVNLNLLHLSWRIRQLPPSQNAIRHSEMQPTSIRVR